MAQAQAPAKAKKVNQPAEGANGATGLAEGGNVEKIRDILFGTQSREFDKRMARLEELLIKESSGLREDLRKKFETLETYIKREVDAIAERLKAERTERVNTETDLTRNLAETAKALERKIAQLDEYAAKNHKELRQLILDQSKDLLEEIKQKHDLLSAGLDRDLEQIKNDKTDRSALADLYTEIAVRLNNNFKLPGRD